MTDKVCDKVADKVADSVKKLEASMPLSYGTRYLTNEDEMFTQNAWDNVKLTDEDIRLAREKIKAQRESPLSPADIRHLLSPATNKWDEFYRTHDAKFFKNRKWLVNEFPLLFKETSSETRVTMMEIGCGVGNALLPLLEASQNPNLRLYGCDISQHAVDLIKRTTQDPRVHVFQCDITLADSSGQMQAVQEDEEEQGDEEEEQGDEKSAKKLKVADSQSGCSASWADLPIARDSIDYATLIYVLSAIPPAKMEQTMRNIYARMKPGGVLYYRDYGKYDLTQLRIKKHRYIDEHFYSRGDGTLVAYMDEASCRALFEKVGFQVLAFKCDNRLLVNRKNKTKMYRIWLQCELVK